MPWSRASFSALAPSEIVQRSGMSGLTIRQPSVVECSVASVRAYARSGLSTTHGARLIDSTPPTSTSEASPVSTARDACIAASRLEPHRRLTVAPGTEVGRPASSTAIRATLRLSSPAPLALPNSTSSIRAGSRSGERASSSRTTWAARSSGRTRPARRRGGRTACGWRRRRRRRPPPGRYRSLSVRRDRRTAAGRGRGAGGRQRLASRGAGSALSPTSHAVSDSGPKVTLGVYTTPNVTFSHPIVSPSDVGDTRHHPHPAAVPEPREG